MEYKQEMLVLAEATRDYRANVDRIREGRARFFGFSETRQGSRDMGG